MHNPSFSEIEYGMRKRMTKHKEFLRAMDEFIPWGEWVAYIEPYYPKGHCGRQPMGIEKMLRMYLLQCWLNLSDEGIEDAIYDSYALRFFYGFVKKHASFVCAVCQRQLTDVYAIRQAIAACSGIIAPFSREMGKK